MKKLVFPIIALFLNVQFLTGISPVYAKKNKAPVEKSTTKSIPVEIESNPKSPVAITSARTKLDLDEYGSPVDARIYIKYKNVGNRPIAAVRFRLNYLDKESKEIGFFHALHAAIVSPDATAEGKWNGKVSPELNAIKVSPLLVRYPAGKDWKSKKMLEIEEDQKEVKPEDTKKTTP